MGRTTQEIGLTQQARDFVKNLKPLESTRGTTGLFEEHIPLGEWEGEDGIRYQEVVQIEPWSSGPMIFTRLKMVKDGNDCGYCFSWVPDREMKHSQVDHKRGVYNV